MLGLVRTWKANKPARDTHNLERADVGIGQDIGRIQARSTHFLEGTEVGTG